jgi:phosphohistidine phosphatase
MKTLLILRHAKSSWAGHTGDHDRPLNDRGRRDAPRMGELMRTEELLPDLILTSTAVRAHTTARLVADAGGFEGSIESLRSLYHGATEDFLSALRTVPDSVERVLVVAHNPGLEELLDELTGEDEVLPTAALAQVALPVARWSQLRANGTGELLNLWRPRELRR